MKRHLQDILNNLSEIIQDLQYFKAWPIPFDVKIYLPKPDILNILGLNKLSTSNGF